MNEDEDEKVSRLPTREEKLRANMVRAAGASMTGDAQKLNLLISAMGIDDPDRGVMRYLGSLYSGEIDREERWRSIALVNRMAADCAEIYLWIVDLVHESSRHVWEPMFAKLAEIEADGEYDGVLDFACVSKSYKRLARSAAGLHAFWAVPNTYGDELERALALLDRPEPLGDEVGESERGYYYAHLLMAIRAAFTKEDVKNDGR